MSEPAPPVPSQRPPAVGARAWVGRALRVLLMLAPVPWLLQKVSPREIAQQIRQVGPGVMATALGCMLLTHVVGALRLRALAWGYGGRTEKLGVGYLTRMNVIAQYFVMLPSGMAGDVFRGVRMSPAFDNPVAPYMVLLSERITGLLALLTITAASVASTPSLMSGVLGKAMLVGIVGALGAGGAAFVLPRVIAAWDGLRALLVRLPLAGKLIARLPTPQRWWVPFAVMPLALSIHVLIVASMWLLVRAADPSFALLDGLRVIPAIVLATQFAVTPGALGQREFFYVQFLGLVGVPAAAATAGSLAYFASVLLLVLIGGVALWLERMFLLSRRAPLVVPMRNAGHVDADPPRSQPPAA